MVEMKVGTLVPARVEMTVDRWVAGKVGWTAEKLVESLVDKKAGMRAVYLVVYLVDVMVVS